MVAKPYCRDACSAEPSGLVDRDKGVSAAHGVFSLVVVV